MIANQRLANVEQVARRRIAATETEIRRTLANVAAGNPLASEKSPPRLVARLMAKSGMTREEAEATAMGIRAYASMSDDNRAEMMRESAAAGGPEAIWGQSIDFVGIAFLERGRRAANAVARVAYRNGRPWGSGFMVTDRLFLTNHHVIAKEAEALDLCAEFDFELDIRDKPLGKSSFAFDPATMFLTDGIEGLDFTLIALGEQLSGQRVLSTFGHCPLSDAADKHAIGEVVNIVQHPNGRYKEVVLRENRLVARAAEALHYVADTEPGSSGSPVFNNEWQVVALHHWGGAFHNVTDEKGVRIPREVNEGLRISSIVGRIKASRAGLATKQRAMVDEALQSWAAAVSSEESGVEASPVATKSNLGPRQNADGSVTWTFPIELTVRAPLIDGARQGGGAAPSAPASSPASAPAGPSIIGESVRAPDEDYDSRPGYEPGFIEGHVVPLPRLSAEQRDIAARNRNARRGDNPFELKYHHFSAVVNAKRKLTFFTACNIDGRLAKFINRKNGTVVALDPANPDHGLQEALPPGAEATEEWHLDPRLNDGEIAGQDVYEKQVLAGFPTSSGMKRTLRMFQRGHLVRRLDPAWGTKNQALDAEADTFHFTNCAPQVGFFNMGQGPNKPGTGGGKLWRAVENIVLRNARTERSRVISFCGPIFANNDRTFRTIKIPKRFFKIAVWADEDGLRALGMIADQSPVFGVWPEALFTAPSAEAAMLGSEAFQDPDELERVDDFLTSIEAIEAATDLDFGASVRNADVRPQGGETRLDSLDDVPLTRVRGRAARKSAPTIKARGTRRQAKNRR